MTHTTSWHDNWPATAHVLDAARFNIKRLPKWASIAGWRALALSVVLISSELGLIPTLIVLDVWARWIRRHNTSTLLQADFVMMENLPQVGPARFDQALQREHKQTLRAWRRAYLNEAFKLNSARQWDTLEQRTAEYLQRVHDTQTQWQTSLPMHLHLLESIGLAVHHAPKHMRDTHNKARRFLLVFIHIQLFALYSAQLLDTLANACHTRGAGILERDLPRIPFPVQTSR